MKSTNRTRGGFTMIELVLASAVGALVVLGAMGIFSMLGRAERRSELRADAATELARLHVAFQRALRTVVTEVKPRPPRTPGKPAGTPTAKPSTTAQDAQPEEEAREEEPVLTGPPRLNLAIDDQGQPKLELMVAASPVPVKLEGGLGVLGFPEVGGGVWGKFELRATTPVSVAEANGRTLHDVYWCVYKQKHNPVTRVRARNRTERADESAGEEPPDEIGEDVAPEPVEPIDPRTLEFLGETIVARDIVALSIEFLATQDGKLQPTRSGSARYASELPAYVHMTVEHKDGVKADWAFETLYVNTRAPNPIADPETVASFRAGRQAGAAGREVIQNPVPSGAGGTGTGGAK